MANLVANGDFSREENGRPLDWVVSGDPAAVDQELTVAYEDGRPYARLVCTRCDDGGGARHAMIAQTGRVRLARGRHYELSCRVRAEGVKSHSISVGLRDTGDWQPVGLSKQLSVAEEWREYHLPFEATKSVGTTGRLQFWFNEPGTLCLADVRIVEFTPDQVVFTHTVAPAAGKNLLPNGSFELGMIGWGAMGQPVAWGNLDRLQGRIESDGAVDGGRFLRVPLGGPDGPMLHWDYYEPVVRRLRMMLAANLGWIPVEPGQSYTLSCSMRASVAGARATLGVWAESPGARGRPLRDTVRLSTEWQRHSFTFHAQSRYVYVGVGPDLEDESPVAVDVDAVQLETGETATPFEPYAPIEAGIEPAATAGIFTVGEPASVTVRAYNHGAAPERLRVTLRATDFFDEPVELPSVTLDVPARTGVEPEVSLPADWRGFYRLTADFEAAGRAWSQDMRLAIVPERTENDSLLGLNHAFPDPQMIQLAKKAGCTWHRDWTLKWHDLEPTPGEYRWEIGDTQIDRVLAEDVQLMALMPPYPSTPWNTSVPPNAEVSDRWPQGLAWAPKDPRQLGEFIERAVGHYKDRVQVWEFLNEPIYTHYALPAREGRYTPADYVDLLAIASAAMHRADPDCRVIGGIGSWPRKLTREVIEAGCLDHVDIFVLHVYPGRERPEHFIEQTDTLLRRMERRGGRKPFWITEFSYYGEDEPRTSPQLAESGWAAERLLADERECAAFTIRFFAIMMARGTEKIFVHAGVGGWVNASSYNCCFFKYGGAPARLFPALAVYTELMGSKARFAAEKRIGEGGFCVGFETDRRSVCVLWDATGPKRLSVPDGVECVDLMGRPVAGRTVTVAPTPIYLVGAAGEAARMVGGVRWAPE